MKITNDDLKKIRLVLHYSQETMADIIGISQSTYNRIENGKRTIKTEDIDSFFKAFSKAGIDLLKFLDSNTNHNNDMSDLQIIDIEKGYRLINLLIDEKNKRIEDNNHIIKIQKQYIEHLEEKVRNLERIL